MSQQMNHRLWMYENMVRSRAFEDAIKPAYLEGKQPLFNMAKGPIPGEMHLSDGQEPCAVGVCVHLRATDFVTATHRPHHIAIAKGVDLNGMAAEIFGKESGLSGGRGGHMHIFDTAVNFSCSGIIAQGMGPAVGAAMAAKMKGLDDVAVAFIGEGAANQGAFHETLNLAVLWQAPVVFVVEDNAWGISVPKQASTSVKSIADRASAYGMPGVAVAGNDADAIFLAAGEAIDRARSGGGPSLLELETYRLEGHFMGDAQAYRPEGELEALKAIDPIPLYRQQLMSDGAASDNELLLIERKAQESVDQAFVFARAAQLPSSDSAYDCVFL